MDGSFPALFLVGSTHRLAVDRDHVGRRAGRDPGDEALLEFLRVKRREDVAELVMRRSVNGRNRRSNSRFFVPKRAISTTLSAPASTARRQSSSTSSSG